MPASPAPLDSKYLTLLDALDAVVYVADMETYEILFLNKMARESSGGSIGATCWKTLQKDQDGPCPFCTNKFLLDEQGNPTAPHVWEVQNTQNGEWWECHDQAIEWADGRIVRLEIATNITQRKQAEQVQSFTEQRYLELFENMRSGVAIYQAVDDGNDFVFQSFNRAAETIEQISREQVIGRRVTDVFPGVIEFGLLDVFKQVWKTGQPQNHPVTIYQDDRIQGWRENYVYQLPSGELVAIYEDVTQQKQAEEELQKKKETLSIALQGANSGLWDWNVKTGEVTFDENYYQIVGYAPFEFPQAFDEWEKRVHPDDLERVTGVIEKTLLTGSKDYSAEFRFRTKKNTWSWILAQGKIVEVDENQTPLRFVGLHTVIDNIKEAEEALRASEEKFRGFFENSLVGIFQSTPDGRYLTANQAFADMLGYDSPQQLISSVTDIAEQLYVYPEKRQANNRNLERDGFSLNFAHQLKRRDGSLLWINTSSRVVRDQKGNIDHYEGVGIDISEQKQAEIDLRNSKENLRITLNSIGDAVIATDINQNIVQMNPIAEQLTGWTETQAQGKRLIDVFRIINERTRETAENPVSKALSSRNPVALANHTVLIAQDGTECQVADSAAPIFEKDGTISGAVLVFRDVTEEYRIRNELYKMQQLESIGTLAGGIAHDFNNILSGIFGNIELAKMRLEPEHRCHKLLDQAEASADRAKKLTGQLLTFAKGGEPIKDHVSLGELIQEVAAFDLSGSHIKLVFEQPEDIWSVDVDKGQIQQVISNLVINASQAMPDGGHLFIALENYEQSAEGPSELEPGPYVRIDIRDEGAGIPEENLLKIFDPYFTTKKQGRGLGLTTVYSIIKRHEGLIQAQSDPQQGTIFTLYLPANEVTPEPIECVTPVTTVETKTLKALVMDDEEIIRILTAEMLEGLEGTCDMAADGPSALGLYRQAQESGDPYDVVILDLTIPGGMGGKETMEKLLEIDPGVKAIVSSGYADDPIMAQYEAYGFIGVVTKPYTIDELKAALVKVIS